MANMRSNPTNADDLAATSGSETQECNTIQKEGRGAVTH